MSFLTDFWMARAPPITQVDERRCAWYSSTQKNAEDEASVCDLVRLEAGALLCGGVWGGGCVCACV